MESKGREFKPGRSFLISLTKDEDLLLTLKGFCQKNRIKTAWISGIGALSRAAFGFYDEEKKQYLKIEENRQLEILSCQGNLSLKAGEPLVHLHITLADDKGKTSGGHLLEGCKIFAGEFYLQELLGEPPVREKDPATSLYLWKF